MPGSVALFAEDKRSDDQIYNLVRQRLANDPDIKGGALQVEVKDGVVTISGEVDKERFIRTIEHAIDLGCNFIDCANNYGKGQSEILLGQAIKGKRDNWTRELAHRSGFGGGFAAPELLFLLRPP